MKKNGKLSSELICPLDIPIKQIDIELTEPWSDTLKKFSRCPMYYATQLTAKQKAKCMCRLYLPDPLAQYGNCARKFIESHPEGATPEECSIGCGTTTERIRQIEHDGIQHLTETMATAMSMSTEAWFPVDTGIEDWWDNFDF